MNCNEAFSVFELPSLTRNSHQTTAAGVHLPHFAKAMWGSPKSTALGSDKGLDVLYSTPSHFVSRAPCISGYLRALASRPGEKSGLVCTFSI